MSMSDLPEDPQSQQRDSFSNASPLPEATVSATMPSVSTTNSSSGLMSLLHPGELLVIFGGIVTLVAFYNLPFLSSGSFTVLGKDLASRSWQLTTQGWQLPANASGARWLLWLMVLFVLLATIVAALRLLGIVKRGERSSRLLLVSGGAAVLLLLIGLFTQHGSYLGSGFSLGIGFWLALASTIVLTVGAYLEVRLYLHQ